MKKNTLKKVLSSFALLLAGFSMYSQDFYNNSGFTTGTVTANGTTVAPLTYTWSELQSVGGVTNSSLGFTGHYLTYFQTNFRLADDFTVPAGQQLNITSIDFYCYQTNFTGTVPPIDELKVQIWSGDPSIGTSTVLAGNLSANVYSISNSGEAMSYRIDNISPGTTRKIWRIRAMIAVNLAPGTYWVDYQAHPTNNSAMSFPPVTLVGTVNLPTWNAKQHNGSSWAPIFDEGSNLSVDMPFVINYDQFLGTESFAINNKVLIYPNPASSAFKIKINYNALQEVPSRLELYDLKGSLVLAKEILELVDGEYQIDISSLEKGIYVVKILDQSKNNIANSKLLKS